MYWHDGTSKQSNSPSAFQQSTRLLLLLAVFGTLLALLLLLRGLVTLSLPAFAVSSFGVTGRTGGGGGLGFPVLLRLLLGELVRFPGNIEGLPENID